MKKLILITLASLAMMACGNKKQQKPLTDEERKALVSGIVVVTNHYYYELTVGDMKYYFSDFSDYLDGDDEFDPETFEDFVSFAFINLTPDIKNIIGGKRFANVQSIGFFVSEDGKIVTTKMVADPNLNLENIQNLCFKGVNVEKNYTANQLAEIADEIATLSKKVKEYDDWGMSDMVKTERAQLKELQTQQETLTAKQAKLDKITAKQISVKCISDIRIAYVNSMANFSDLEPAVLVNSDETMALIQLQSKAPIPNTHLFEFAAKLPAAKEKVWGFACEDGRQTIVITQYETSVDDVINDEVWINELHTPGAPLLNEFGEVVAVTYYDEDASYGISAKVVKKLL